LEKVFDRVHREVLYWSLRRKGISAKLVRIIKSVYDGAVTTVRSGRGKTLVFEKLVYTKDPVSVHCCLLLLWMLSVIMSGMM